MNAQNEPLSTAPIPLELPTIPVALEGGLIPVEHLTNPVMVNFPVWPAAEAGYTYQLVFEGQRVPPEKVILNTDKPGDTLQVQVPVALLSEGMHAVSYRVYSPNTGVEDYSDAAPMQIDRTAPGAPDLAPLIFPPDVLDGLTSDELDAMNGVLTGRIASYSGMAIGDTLRTYWGDVSGPVVVVDASDVGLNRVMVDYPRAFLEQIGDGREDVYYTATDRAGNVSMASVKVAVELKLSELHFDTSPVTLGGKVYLLPSHPDVLPTLPADTSVQRAASGGVPPYSYRSSDPQVAHVSETGFTSVRGNGITTITVTDALGQSLSYEVTVTGVVACIDLAIGKFKDVSDAASGNGARLPTIQELREIYALWREAWPLTKSQHWSSTLARATPFGKTYYQKHLGNGRELDGYSYSSIAAIGIR